MDIKDFSDEEINKIVNSFKAYVKLVVEHSAIDFARKVKAKKYKIVSLNEVSVEKEASLLVSNNDASFSLEDIFDERNSLNIFTDSKYAKVFEKLTDNERKILNLYSRNYTPKQIAKILGMSVNNVKIIKFRAIKRFKKMMKEGN